MLAPVVSVTSRSSIGRNAIFSRTSAPPICISVVTSGVWQRSIGPPAVAISLGAEFATDLELDSCATPLSAANRTAQLRIKNRTKAFVSGKITSILCRAQYRGQILREARACQYFIAPRGLRLSGELPLHVRQEAHYANVLARLPQLFNRLKRLAPRVQIHDNKFWLGRHEFHQCLAIRGHFHFHAKLFGGFRQLHLEKQIIHQRHDSSHPCCPRSIHPHYYAPLLLFADSWE